MKPFFFFLSLILTLSFGVLPSETLSSAPIELRWTRSDQMGPELESVLSKIQEQTGQLFSTSDFILIEDRALATSHFHQWSRQDLGLPVHGELIRVWSMGTQAIQIEVHLTPIDAQAAKGRKAVMSRLTKARKSLDPAQVLTLAKNALRRLNTSYTPDFSRGIEWVDLWVDSAPVRRVTLQGKRGVGTVDIHLLNLQVLTAQFEEHPQGETFSLVAPVFPIYEEVESSGQILGREMRALRHLRSQVKSYDRDPYEALKARRYFDSQYDPLRGLTEQGRAQGLWAPSWLKSEAEKARLTLMDRPNTFYTPGIQLEGLYATIQLHPAVAQLSGLQFQPKNSTFFMPHWAPRKDAPDSGEWEMTPSTPLLGKPLTQARESWMRPARRLPDHAVASYINDGFDEIQVYYAINELFDQLHKRGFTDPDLSTRPFHAFLYDPDIEMRDNAYYSDDTINFTTYSPKNPNYARDNPTIWHELGHGLMDRLMGDHLKLADTGGLSEGMADFLASLVVTAVSKNREFPGSSEFRIMNKIGFLLSNEVHDDGEAYGGAMQDMLETAMKEKGWKRGLHQMTDLTLEAMRLARNHPHLTAQDWFARMLYADELGREGLRKPGELRDTILGALNSRNFSLDGSAVARFHLTHAGTEIDANAEGSRGKPIRLHFEKGETSKTKSIEVSLVNGAHYAFQFPVQVRVDFKKGALQGAIHWDGEEENPRIFTMNHPDEKLEIPLTVTGTCDFSNREDGSCVDYAYIQIWNAGETLRPVAKKRFYLRVFPASN